MAKELQSQNEAIKGGGAAKQGDNSAGFPELSQPHLVLASPAGIQTTTAQSTHIASDEHTALTSGGHTSISAGRSLLVSVKKAIRMFASEAGMRLAAAAADIEVKALRDNINLLAKLDITHRAKSITLTAKEEVLINGGGSYSRWSASGIAHGTLGSWVEHAAGHAQEGPKSLPVVMPRFPTDVCVECLLKRAAQKSAFVKNGD